jgi:hypothetical protein
MVGTTPTFSALPVATVLVLALGTKGGGEAMVSPLLAKLQAQQVHGGLSLIQAELLTDSVPLGRGRRFQGVSAGTTDFYRVFSGDLEGTGFIVLGFHLRNRPFVNQNSRFPFSFQIPTQSTEGAGEGIRPSTGKGSRSEVRFSDSPLVFWTSGGQS